MKLSVLKNALIAIALFSSFNTFSQNGLSFDGTDDFVQTTSPGVLASTNRTFEAWVYVSSSAPASSLCISDYGANIVGSRNTFAVTGTRALTFISGGTNANISSSPGDVPVDQWAHVAFTLDNGTGYLYVNGIQVGTGSLTTVNTPSGNSNIIIGERVSGGSIPFYGSIDEVRIWNVAKTPAQLLANMNNELCTIPVDLVAYYKFNQGVAGGTNTGLTALTDGSGNGFNGTLNTFALTGASSNWVTGAPLAVGATSSNSIVSACDTYTWAANTTTYTSSGNYSVTLAGANASGCDSTLNLDLTINISNDLTTNVSACDTYTWGINSTTYTSSTFVSELLTNGQGCTYTHNLNLSIGYSNTGSATVSECENYTWSANGTTYTSGGSFTETLTNASGCDSVATLNLTITALDSTITDNGNLTWSANAAGASYQWLDCDDNYAAMPGETNQLFVPGVMGYYAVEITDGNCVDTSACFEAVWFGLEESTIGDFSLYPNPTEGEVIFDFSKIQGTISISVLSLEGQLIAEYDAINEKEFTLNLEGAGGVYLIEITNELGESVTRRVVKK